MSVRGIAALSLSAALAVACGSPKPAGPPPTPISQTTSPTSTRAASQSVAVGEDLAKICNLSVASVEKAPKFDYDHADLTSDDRDVLSQIARCFTTGPMKGRALKLVGRADPRGEPEYNMTLGDHRAGSVKQYLTQLGVEPKRIAETSRGELDATGRDENGWRRDRRVDVLLQ